MNTSGELQTGVVVIGLGNVLLGDDGFGPSVIEILRAGWEFPESVTLVDAGTAGLDLVTFLLDQGTAILVDTVGAHGCPGELRLYRGDELRALPPKPRVSPHDPAVQEALWIAELSGCGPRRVLLFGVIPGLREPGAGLSDPVRTAASFTAALIVRELTNSRATPRRRSEPRASSAWWLRTSPIEATPSATLPWP